MRRAAVHPGAGHPGQAHIERRFGMAWDERVAPNFVR
jgi:hypothetical protein